MHVRSCAFTTIKSGFPEKTALFVFFSGMQIMMDNMINNVSYSISNTERAKIFFLLISLLRCARW